MDIEEAMISTNVQQQTQQQHQQQVDNRKSTNANYNRKTQINLAQYSNSRNTISDSYFLHDYQLTDSSNSTASINTESTPTSSTIPITASSLTSGLIVTETKSNVNLINDQISALFPKCRPKNDSNLNKTTLFIDTTNHQTLTSASALLASSPSSNDIKNQNQLFGTDSVNSIGHALTDTIHQRAINYSKMNNIQNNTNADNNINNAPINGTSSNGSLISNTSSLAELNQRMNLTNFQLRNGAHRGIISTTNTYHGGNGLTNERFVWEKRRRSPNTTPASTVLNSPDLSEVNHYSHHPVQHQIKVGRSPVSQHEHSSSKNSASPVSPIVPPRQRNNRPVSLVSEGEVVVFDDIENSWSNGTERDSLAQKQQMQPKQAHNAQPKQHFHHMLFDDDDEEDHDSNNTNSFNTDKVTKMIGKLKDKY